VRSGMTMSVYSIEGMVPRSEPLRLAGIRLFPFAP
jgi:hypothetical protein